MSGQFGVCTFALYCLILVTFVLQCVKDIVLLLSECVVSVCVCMNDCIDK